MPDGELEQPDNLEGLEAALVDLISIDREIASRGLRAFIRIAWPLVEPSRPFLDNWHIGAICEHLEAVSRGELTRLVINIPPGCMKSLTVCVFWLAWEWTQTPGTKWIFASFADTLARRDSNKTRRLLESPWYQQRWGETMVPQRGDAWGAGRFENKAGGSRLATSVGGAVTGDHADRQVVDDPTKPLEVTGSLSTSSTALNRVKTWWSETMASRLVDPELSARVIIMQRLHQNDLAGHVLKEGGYEHVMLPMQFDKSRRCITSLGVVDKRVEDGEPLWLNRFSEKAVTQARKEYGPRGAAAQLDQNPTPAGGSIFKREWIRYFVPWEYKGDPAQLSPPAIRMPQGRARYIQTWDLAFKGTDTSDPIAGHVWATLKAKFFWFDRFYGREGFAGSCEQIRAMSDKWPKAITKLVEDAANGPAVCEALDDEITGLRLVKPQGGKEVRAHAVEPLFAAGNVYFLHPSIAPWVSEVVETILAFPATQDDHDVDAMTQGLIHLHGKGVARYREAMQTVMKSGGLKR